MPRPRSRPAVHIMFTLDWYDGPLSGLVRVDGREGLHYFGTVHNGPRVRRYAVYETPPGLVMIIKAERKLFERMVYPRWPVPGLSKRWYDGYGKNRVPRPPLGRVLFTFKWPDYDHTPAWRHHLMRGRRPIPARVSNDIAHTEG